MPGANRRFVAPIPSFGSLDTPSEVDRPFTYQVAGSWPFPTDMLRHDGSRPATEADARAIEALSGPHAPDRDSIRSPVTITLAMTDVGRPKPNTARWESFGWSVPGDEGYAQQKEIQRQSDARNALRHSALAKLTPEERAVLGWADAEPSEDPGASFGSP